MSIYTLEKTLERLIKEFTLTNKVTLQDVYEIVEGVLNIKRAEIFFHPDVIVEPKSLEIIEQFLKRRAAKEPLEYILGEKVFYGLTLKVTPDVLIPRHETEILVDKIKRRLQDREPQVVVDICCGSGCIGLAMKKIYPHARVILTDVCPKALEIARLNASSCSLDVEFLCTDLAALLIAKGIKADLIVCNPPYISEAEYSCLEKEVLEHEPKKALVSGESGLECYRRLREDVSEIALPGAFVAFEIGCQLGEAVKNLFSCKPWISAQCEKDYAGLDRFIFLERES